MPPPSTRLPELILTGFRLGPRSAGTLQGSLIATVEGIFAEFILDFIYYVIKAFLFFFFWIAK